MKTYEQAIALALPGQQPMEPAFAAATNMFGNLSRRSTQKREQLQYYSDEYRIAAEIQRHLLPKSVPQPYPFDLAATCRPCRTLGGDFYDFFPLCGGHGIAIGDVSGKGLPASILMTSLRASLRAHAEDLKKLPDVIRHVNDDFVRDTRDHEFATLFLGVLDASRSRLTYCSAGHEPALLVRDGRVTPLEAGGMALGICAGEQYVCETISLRRDDLVVIFTDGVTEARDAAGLMFGRERVAHPLLRTSQPRTALEACRDIVTELGWFVGRAAPSDDVTLVTIGVGGDDSGAAHRPN